MDENISDLPEWVQRFHVNNRPVTVDELLPGEDYVAARGALKSNKVYEYTDFRTGAKKSIGAVVKDGYVMALAAVNRKPQRSFDFVRDITDFTQSVNNRQDNIPVLYRIYKNEGMVNNGVNKLAGLVSHEGRIYVKNAKKGKKKASRAKEELSRALDFWLSHVNARPSDAPITGARGATQIMEQGTRQCLIEGSYIGYSYDHKIKVPSLEGKEWNMPMFIQSISTQFIQTPDWAAGTGLEEFYWTPTRELINVIRSKKETEEKKVLEQAFPKEVLRELQESGRLALDRERVYHVKHRGTDFTSFGESYIEPLVADIAYKRALQQLDFVTIDSLVNRIVIIKVGSDNPSSDYHNLEAAQLRVQALERVVGDPGPNMQIIWAGPDIEIIEVSAHDSILSIDGRHAIAVERMLLSMGIPRALLDGKDATGQVWAGYEGLRETLRALLNNWVSCWTTAAERIAVLNGFDDVELVYTPTRNVLADQTAGADLALKAMRAGLMSRRRAVGEIGGNFEAERRNLLIERGYDPDGNEDSLPTDEEIFAPPVGFPGDTRNNDDGDLVRPGEPGRPRDTERIDLEDERDTENRNPRDGK
jgi:hypothetical protein